MYCISTYVPEKCLFAVAAESALKMHFHRFLREDWGEFQNGMYVEGGRRN